MDALPVGVTFTSGRDIARAQANATLRFEEALNLLQALAPAAQNGE